MTRTTLLLLVLWITCVVNSSTIGNSVLVQHVPADLLIRVPRNPTVYLTQSSSMSLPHRLTQIKCDEDNSYQFLSMCIEECGGIVDDEDNDFMLTPYEGYDSPYTPYKLLILDNKEFIITTNGSLQTNLPDSFTFPPKNFIQKNGKAYLCFPMPEEFMNCQHWVFDEKAFLFKKEYRLIWLKRFKKHYKVWEYVHRKSVNEIWLCDKEETFTVQKDMAIPVAWILNLICLGVLIVLSQIFPILNMKNNKILLCNLSVLFVSWLIPTIVNLDVDVINQQIYGNACHLVAYFQQYIFLSFFCWTNVQAIDVFLKFKNLRVSQVDTVQDKREIVLYNVHGWLTPLLITAITGLADAFDAPNLNPKMSKICWFETLSLSFLYFYGPISLSLIINMVLFILTVYKLCTTGKGSNVMKKEHCRFKVHIKLMFVISITWTMFIISIGVDNDDYDWEVINMIFALQGVFLFIVYTCKPIFMRRLFNLICRHRKCPTWWPLVPLSMEPTEATCSTVNSSDGTLSRTDQDAEAVDTL